MDNMTLYSVERTFQNKKEFHARDKVTWYKDTIYRGMFEKSLLKEGYSLKELDFCIEKNYLKKSFTRYKDGSLRTSYLYIKREMPQRETFKIWIDKIYRFIKGQYKEYY